MNGTLEKNIYQAC